MNYTISDYRTHILTGLACLAFVSLVVSSVTLLGTHKIFEVGLLGRLPFCGSWIFFGSSATGFTLFALTSIASYYLNRNVHAITKKIDENPTEEIIKEEDPVKEIDTSSVVLQLADLPSNTGQKFSKTANALSSALELANHTLSSLTYPNLEADFQTFKVQISDCILKIENLMGENLLNLAASGMIFFMKLQTFRLMKLVIVPSFVYEIA